MTRFLKIQSGLFLLSGVVAVGCSDNGGGGTTDAGTTGDATILLDTGGGGEVDAGGEPSDDTIADAIAITGSSVMGAINPAEDVDFYSFSGTAGSWTAIATTANEEDDGDGVDTVVRLFGPDMQLIAENDDGLPRFSPDSELIVKLPTTGTYYVEVQEYSTWENAEDPPEPAGSPDFTYELFVVPLAELDAITLDAETGNDAASATALELADNGVIAVGDFEADADVDAFSFSSGTQTFADLYLMPFGTTGDGSTASSANVWLTTAAAPDVILARIGTATDTDNLFTALAPSTDYILWTSTTDSRGSNPFYVVKVTLMNGLNTETDDTANGTIKGAQALPLDTDGIGYVVTSVGNDDTDYFSVAITGDGALTAFCDSSTYGSGVNYLQIALTNAAGDELDTSTETLENRALIDAYAIEAAGTYYLRVRKTGQSPEIAGTMAYCELQFE